MPTTDPETATTDPNTATDAAMTELDDLVVVDKLRKTYGTTVAVADVSLTVRKGEIFGILGPNGAGKTTTVEAIAGLRTPDSGTVRVVGLDPRRRRTRITQLIGVQLQASELPDRIKPREALALYASFYPDPADPAALLDRLGLTKVQDTPFAKLSGGQKQRLSIALALIGNPQIAILDELTTGLDPQARRDTWELVRQIRDSGVTIILVTHFMEEAEYLCDRIAIIDAGRVVALDTPAGLVAAAQSEHRITFKLAQPLDDAILTALPDVSSVLRRDDRIVVNGNENLLVAVVTELAGRGLVPVDLHTEQATLDDAFLALAGRRFEATGSTATDGKATNSRSTDSKATDSKATEGPATAGRESTDAGQVPADRSEGADR